MCVYCAVCAVGIIVSVGEFLGPPSRAWLCGIDCKAAWLTQRRLEGRQGSVSVYERGLFLGTPTLYLRQVSK